VSFAEDNGALVFMVSHHSDRTVKIVFPYFESPEMVRLQDTVGLHADLPDGPTDFVKFRIYNSSGFADPKPNFLKMTPEVPQRVRLWTTSCTSQRHYFFLEYSAEIGRISGIVEAVAHANDNGQLVRWEIYPVPGTKDEARIYKHPESVDDSIDYPFGEFPMPFHLTLERR
jgi:hypothetical protein